MLVALSIALLLGGIACFKTGYIVVGSILTIVCGVVMLAAVKKKKSS